MFPYAAAAGPRQLRVYPELQALTISTYSQHKQAAFEYVAWYTSKDVESR